MKSPLSIMAQLSLLGMALLTTVGCDNWAMRLRQQMYNQKKYLPQEKSDFFADGRTNRPLVEGVVPQGKIDDHLNKAMVDGKPATTFPFPISRKDIERGMHRFNIYCSPCHGKTGDGWGMVVRRGFMRPPSFHEARLKAVPVSHFFNVITQGIGMMSGYAAQVPVEDRWRIIAYVRALQLSQDGKLSDVPAAERSQLEGAK